MPIYIPQEVRRTRSEFSIKLICRRDGEDRGDKLLGGRETAHHQPSVAKYQGRNSMLNICVQVCCQEVALASLHGEVCRHECFIVRPYSLKRVECDSAVLVLHIVLLVRDETEVRIGVSLPGRCAGSGERWQIERAIFGRQSSDAFGYVCDKR